MHFTGAFKKQAREIGVVPVKKIFGQVWIR